MSTVADRVVAGVVLLAALSPAAAAVAGTASPRALHDLKADAGPRSTLRLHPLTGGVRFLHVQPGGLRFAGSTPRDRADAFLRRHREAFGIGDPALELADPEVVVDALGRTRVVYAQRHEGVPVFGGELRVHFDRDGELTAANGTILSIPPLATSPTVPAHDAAATALREVRHRLKRAPFGGLTAGTPRRVVYRPGLAERLDAAPRLAYEVEIADGAGVREWVYVDAHAGAVLEVLGGVRDALTRQVHQATLQQPLWVEGDALPFDSGNPADDPQVNGLIDRAREVYEWFLNLSGTAHPSWDGGSAAMTTIWRPAWLPCPNATWNGTSVNFCDGVTGDDVVAHEWVHAYTQGTHDLIYRAQPGALNEAYSDIFGELIDLLNGSGLDAPDAPRQAGDCSVHGGSPSPVFTVTAPAHLAGTHAAAGAAFNPPGALDVSGAVELVFDNQNNGGATSATDGCEPLVGFTPGRLALIDRGGCPFGTKALNAQNAGAIAVVVVNSDDGLLTMGGSAPGLAIPAVIVGQATGNAFRAEFIGSVHARLTTQQATADSVRWLIGEDSPALGPIRDLWNPTCLGSPGKTSDVQYVCGDADAGGVHTNSGVPNHAFALLVDGGEFNGQTVTAIGAVKAAHLYWRAMDTYQVPDTDFADHAAALLQSCADLVGAELTDPRTGSPAAESFVPSDCDQVAAAVLAVELEEAPDCAFAPLLAPDPPAAACGTALFHDDFESDPAGRWHFDHAGVFAEYVSRDWEWRSALPARRPGSALFAADGPLIGDCISGFGDQSRRLGADTPPIALGDGAVLSFEHYVATEHPFDGGNVKISVNGGPFASIGAGEFQFNPYNATLAGPGNTNPLAGQAAFSGSDGGVVTGSWGVSRVSLAARGGAGDTAVLRFDFGADGCGGLDGWYVDDLSVCTSTVTAGRVPDGRRLPGVPLTLDRAGPGSDLDLAWGRSCHGADTDYAVYEGTLGNWASHVSRLCSTRGATAAPLAAQPGSRYFLVVPTNGTREGSYGSDSAGNQRPPGLATCRPQALFPGCVLVGGPGNHAPIIGSTPPPLADHNRPWSYAVEATDPDGDALSVTIDFKPQWMDFDPATRTLSGTAGWENVGSHSARVRVSDGVLDAVQTFTLTVQKGEIVCDQPFGDPAESLYVLPFPVGRTYRVLNAHCPPNPNWGHQNTFALDWEMPIGDPIVASRAGTVLFVRESNADNNGGCGTGGENWVFIRHADGTVMQYVHLTRNGVLVDVGDTVAQGQTIGLSGNTGCSSGPHTHTWLFRDATDFSRKATLPVNYRNAAGPLDANNALVIGGVYTALP